MANFNEADFTTLLGTPQTLLPTAVQDSPSAVVPVRANKYGELVTRDLPTLDALAEEGTLFVATTPTISTGLTWVAAQTAYDATKPNFYLHNQEAAGGKVCRLHSLKLIATAQATGTTAVHWAAVEEVTSRSASVNNLLAISPVNANSGVASSTSVKVYGQNSATASVLAAFTAGARIVGRGTLGGLNIAGDELQILFGGVPTGGLAQTAVAGAGQPSRRVTSAPPIAIAPQHSLTIYFWLVDSSASIDPEVELVFSVK